MVFLKRVPEGSVCVFGVMSPPITQLGGSRADPQHCTCPFLSTPWCRLQVWQGKCAAIIIRGREQLLQGGVYCPGPLGNKKRKRPIKAFPAYRSHVLPLILFPESVCLPRANGSQCPRFQRTEQAVNFEIFPQSEVNKRNKLRPSVDCTYTFHRENGT